MANNYIRPLLAVYQQLEITLAATGDHLHACVIGPNYNLYRYGIEPVAPHKFKSSGDVIAFDYDKEEINDYVVDTATVNVYAEGLEASLATVASGFTVDPDDIMTVRLVQPDGASKKNCLYINGEADEDHQLLESLSGLGTEVGDIVYVKAAADGGSRRRIVIGLAGEAVPSSAHIGSLLKGNTDTTATASDVILEGEDEDRNVSGLYTGDKSTTVYVAITAVNSTDKTVDLSVYDAAGVVTRKSVAGVSYDGDDADPEYTDLGNGLHLAFKASAASKIFSVGDVITIGAVPQSASNKYYDGVVLSAAPVEVGQWTTYKTTALSSVEFRKEYYGDVDRSEGGSETWTIETDETTGEPYVSVKPGMSVNIPGRTASAQFADNTGNLYVSFRVLVQADPNEDMFAIDNEDDIKDYFGTISQENELAYAAYWCLKGAQGRRIYAIRTRGTDVESFHAAIEKTETTTLTYAVAVISNDPEVIADIVAFNDKLSQPEVKRWRRTLCGVDTPGEYTIAEKDNNNNYLTAQLGAYGTRQGETANVLLQVTEDLDFDLTNVRVNGAVTSIKAGDKVRFTSTGLEYTVKTVLSPKELILVAGPETPVSVPELVTFIKADTAVNNVDYVGALAKAFNSRRVTVVWCDGGVLVGSTDVVENKFIAAEVAGISSAVVPQAGITRTEVQSVTNAVKMYTKYRQDQLDDIASNGVMIITQDSKDAPCYIRHQLTTEMDKGSLYYEESPTRNLDNISYAMVDILEGFIGKANVTPSALTAIKVAVISKLNEFTQDSPDPMIGPSLIEWSDLEVFQDPKFMDRVIIKVKLYLPLPLNGIRLYEMAYAATVTI